MAKISETKAHEIAREKTIEKYGIDFVGQEAIDYYNEQLRKALKPKKKKAPAKKKPK
jgi:hypothetical protein